MENLIWKIDATFEYGGYWECAHCGAVYCRPCDWKPFIDYCMKCKGEWSK